jgi:hypothetical protein
MGLGVEVRLASDRPPTSGADYEANLAILRVLVDEGAIELYERGHQWPGCDGMMTCDCPPPVWRVGPEYQKALSS